MKFKKGQIVHYEFPKGIKNENVLFGEHDAVILFSRETPYKTILLAPITSADSLKKVGKIPKNYVELKLDDYIGILEHDSYINLDMIFPVDELAIDELEAFNKKIVKYLEPIDSQMLDYKIALTYELQKYLQEQINKEVETIVEYIDTEIKEKIKKALEVIEDKQILKTIMYIIDNDLIKELKN